MPEEQEQQPKIIVDEDWKQQTQREKEVLKAQEKQEKKAKPPAGGRRSAGQLPHGDFAALVNMLTTQALFAMGLLQIKGEPARPPDLELARYNIDVLEMIEEKTKGNLTEDEQAMLKNTLNEVRMGYVELVNAISVQAKSAAASEPQ